MKQSEIGFIPQEWKVQSIGETFKFSSGKSRPKNTAKEKTSDLVVPVYGGNGILGYTDQVFTNQNHLILGRVGEYCGCVHLTDTSSWISDNALYGKEKLTSDDLHFLKYCFEYLNLNQYSNKMGQPLITQGIINQIKFSVPPLQEQRKIAYILSTVQKAIEQQDKLIRHTTELKKALMQKLFTEGIKGEKQKETEIGMVPESWEVQPFENTGEVVYGIQAAVASNLKPIGHKILTNKNITIEGKIDLEKINYFKLTAKRHLDTILKKGDLLFNWRSGSKEHVGKTAIFDLEDGEYVHSSFILRIRVNKNHNAKFLFYYLNYLS